MKKVKVKFNEDKPEAVEVLAKSIIEISASMRRIEASRLSRRAIVALIQNDVGMNKGAIETVIDSLTNLEQNYLKPKKKEP